MDVVIPYRHSDFNELKYCLRGIEKYVPHLGQVFLVGDKPDWIKAGSLQHLKCMDTPGIHYKEHNIMKKVFRACADHTLTEDFIFMNDDHFLLQPLDYLPCYYQSTIKDRYQTRTAHDHYYHSLMSTHCALIRYKKPTRYLDIHAPIVYNKHKFMEVMTAYSWEQAYGYVVKSLYCNTLGIKGEYMVDLKINDRLKCAELEKAVAGRPFFSTGESANGAELGTFLQYLYRNKSKFEK
jgi:hypothetical protein